MKPGTVRSIILVVVFFAAMMFWQIFALIHDNYPITNFPPKNKVVVALGDSITKGVGATSPASSYIGILESRLNISIINRGVSGDTTALALNRLDTDVLALHPGIVIVFLGGNDYLKRTPQEEIFHNLEVIIKKIQADGGVVLLVGMNGFLSNSYDKAFMTLARQTGSKLVPDVMNDIIGNPEFLSDEIHPNDKGHAKIADRITPTLDELVLSVSPTQVTK